MLQVQRYLSMRSLGEARKAAVLGLTTTMVLILCVGWMGLVSDIVIISIIVIIVVVVIIFIIVPIIIIMVMLCWV